MKKLLMLFSFIAISIGGNAQIETPQPSPFAKVEQKVGLTDVVVEYSRPAMRGRTIFGDLVPYNKLWRTGANANTKITFSDNVTIDGKELDKGTYAIFTTPMEDKWEVSFYDDASNWGTPSKWDDAKVALKTTAEVSELPFNVESFTISIDDLSNDAATLNFMWANTSATLKFNVPTDTKAMASIEKVLNGPGAGDYFAAASYYHDQKKDLDKAYTWIQKATAANPDAFWIWRRQSLIEADLGKKDAAIATAKKSLAAAEKAGNQDYVKMNKDSLKEWGAM